MANENYPVIQTAKLLRVLVPSREGKKGEYAVGLCEHDGHEYTILFCSETFPLDVLNKIIGKIIRVDPTNGRGLRAVDYKHQEFDKTVHPWLICQHRRWIGRLKLLFSLF